MTQLHKRFTDDQVKVLLNGYCQGLLARAEIQEMLDTGKTRFFTLLKEYRKDPKAFSVAHERPYQWLQDRIVRTCALENISAMEDVRSVLKDEVDRYNYHQVHSTTKEIPAIRFRRAKRHGNSLFRPFSLPKPYTSPKDVFCLRETRVVNGYRRISLFNHTIEVPNVELHEEVEIHLVPDTAKQVMEIRIWWHAKMVHSVALPLEGFRVHL